MNIIRLIAVLGFAAVTVISGGCSVPSLHGAYSADKAAEDPALAGTWVSEKGDVTAVVERGEPAEFRVHATVTDDDDDGDKRKPQVMRMDVRLVKLGEFTFADMVLNKDEREGLTKAHNALAVRTHQFMKYQCDGDTVTLWMPDYDRFKTLLESGDAGLTHAKLDDSEKGPDTVITAPTADIQKFLAAHGGDKELFNEPLVLKRQTKP